MSFAGGWIQAQPYISLDTPLPDCYEVEGRVRNGINAYEAAIFTPSTPSPMQPGGAKWKLDPTGKPVWNSNGNTYGDVHTFLFSYTPATGTSVWNIDFNRDGDYNDAKESVTNVAPTLVGKGFQYINVMGQGNDNGMTASLDHFTINGVDFGSYSSSSNMAFNILFEDSTGIFNDITISGEFSFSGYGIPERPRIWIRLGESNFGPPTCVLTNPLDGSFYNPGSTIMLSATATDYKGKIDRVEFYDGDVKIGEDLVFPYTFEYSNMPAGIRVIRAKAVDNQQAIAYSNKASITVNAFPTSIILSPTNGYVFHDPDTIVIEAEIMDANDPTNMVEFFIDDHSIGMDNVPPYINTSLLNQPMGTYSLQVKSSDPYGATSMSPRVGITVRCIREDINNDGVVGTFDFLLLLGSYGILCTVACPPDFNDDGIVDTFDFLRILARFGYSCN